MSAGERPTVTVTVLDGELAVCSIFAMSTYDTDYVLALADAIEALRGAGHDVRAIPYLW